MKIAQSTFLAIVIIALSFTSCKNETNPSNQTKVEQVKIGEADSKAAKIAENIMIAMGGSEKYEDLTAISWTFFGARHLVWDKKGNRVRIESPRDTSVMILDMNTNKGMFSKGGIVAPDDEALKATMETVKSMWINDSYWLVMPFKLRDEGVNLRYLRKDTISGGFDADVLELTFNGVGITPENKYEVFVDNRDDLIKQWDFYQSADLEEPSRSWPWDNYQKIGGLLISSERSDKSGPSNVRIYTDIDDKVFSSLEAFEYY